MIKQILTKLKNLFKKLCYSSVDTTSHDAIDAPSTPEGQLITKNLSSKNYSSLDQKAQSLVKIYP